MNEIWNVEYHGALICGHIVRLSGQIREDPMMWFRDNKDNVVEIGGGFSYLVDPDHKEFTNESGVYVGKSMWYPRYLEYRPVWHIFSNNPPTWGASWQESYKNSQHWVSIIS